MLPTRSPLGAYMSDLQVLECLLHKILSSFPSHPATYLNALVVLHRLSCPLEDSCPLAELEGSRRPPAAMRLAGWLCRCLWVDAAWGTFSQSTQHLLGAPATSSLAGMHKLNDHDGLYWPVHAGMCFHILPGVGVGPPGVACAQ